MIVEYAGLTQEASTLIEGFRQSPTESKADIIVRVLSPLSRPAFAPAQPSAAQKYLDLGQGVKLVVGEKAYLFLSLATFREERPQAVAVVGEDGFYLDGKLVPVSNKSYTQPAMKVVQEKLGHRNNDGELISLSSWRQWHVIRRNKYTPLEELKDPKLARKRSTSKSLVSKFTAEDLAL